LKRNNNPYQVDDYIKFKKFVKAAFSQRRKTLRNSLKSYVAAEKLTSEIFGKRSEQLSVQAFVDLYNATKNS
jgi:16S rRNA (adenine1518-N6/adenine1519-N6)-dimethyltransferase